MSIADEVSKLDKENRKTKVDLTAALQTIENFKQELTHERAQRTALQAKADKYEKHPLQAQITKLKGELKQANVNTRVKKLKDQLQKLREHLAGEQSLRMKAEHHPKIKKANEELKTKYKRLKEDNDTANTLLRKLKEEKAELKAKVASIGT